MKKNLSVLLFFIIVLLALTSCVASVAVNSWVPSKIDLTGYKTIAIQSTKQQYSFYNSYTQYVPVKNYDADITIPKELRKVRSKGLDNYSYQVVNTASELLTKAFNTGVYKVIGPETTDSIINLAKNSYLSSTVRSMFLKNGIDLVVSSSLDELYYEEFIQPERKKQQDGSELIAYYLYQRAGVVLSYTLQDVETATVIGTNKKTAVYPNSMLAKYRTTLIGYAKVDGTEFKPVKYANYYSAEEIISELLTTFKDEISKEVSPYERNYYIDLKRDPNKSEIMENANTLVSQGEYKAALEIYNEIYSKQNLFAAGYNRAVVNFALGNREDAVDMAYELWSSSYNSQALNLYEKLKQLTESQNKAIKQILGTEKTKSIDVELIGF